MKKKAKVSAVNLAEFEALASKRLAKEVFEALSGGSDDEVTLEENIAAFRRMAVVPRVLRDVTNRKTNTTVLGQAIAFPVLLAPIACLRRFHREGELAVVRAAASAGTICIVSTGACYGFEEIAKSAKGPIWLQLYAYRDKGITQSLVQRAEAAGYQAICVTVDVPLSGRRERDSATNIFIRERCSYRNLKGLGIKGLKARPG